MKRTIGNEFLLMLALCVLLWGCDREVNLKVMYPHEEIPVVGMDMNKVRRAYKYGVLAALEEARQKQASFTGVKISFLEKENIDVRRLIKMNPEQIKEFLTERGWDALLYCEIIHPYKEIPFGLCRLHLIFKRSGLSTHQIKGLLLHNTTFYSKDYWKSESREILKKMSGLL